MSVKHALSRGLELGRSLLQLGLFKASKLHGERLHVSRSTRTVQPQTSLPAQYRFFHLSLSGLAAQLQSGTFRRVAGGGAPRNRAVFLAFGVGLGLIEQQLEEDRTSAALCQEIQFGSQWEVYLSKSDGSYKLMTVEELLPCSSGPDGLRKGKNPVGNSKLQ